MFVMTSQFLKFVDSPKTQKSKYPENEIFFSSYKKFIHYMSKNNFQAEVTFDIG